MSTSIFVPTGISLPKTKVVQQARRCQKVQKQSIRKTKISSLPVPPNNSFFFSSSFYRAAKPHP
jgi:hypothetical protein